MAFDLASARPVEDEEPAAQPPPAPPKFDVASARPVGTPGRYLSDWKQAVVDPLLRPAGGPTGVPLVDAAAGVADFATSAAVDSLTGLPRVALNTFRGARGAPYDPTLLTRPPTTPVGQALQESAGGVFKPVGDALAATGMDPNVAAAVMDVGGTALDLFGLGAGVTAGRAATRGAFERQAAGTSGAEAAGLRAAAEGAPVTPGGAPVRPYGTSVEKARRLNFRLLPSQVAGRVQAEAPVGIFGTHHKVSGTMSEGLTGRDLVPQAIIDNQKRVNAFAARELGISEITPQGLALAKNPHNAVFNEVANALPTLAPDADLASAANAIGEARRNNPLLRTSPGVEDVRDRILTMERIPTQQALDAIRSYRQDAAKYYKQADLGVTGSVEAEQMAQAYRAAADALENAIERQAGALYPGLLPRLRDARTALAKIHNVEDALDGVNVDPQALVKMSERYPLTGYLAEIADIARDFPQTMRSGTGVTLPSDSYTGALMSLNLLTRRMAGREQGPRLLRDKFQNRFGREDPTYDPRVQPTPVTGSPFKDYTPPDPNAPGGADVMPPAPGGGPGLGAVNLADDFIDLPPAETFPGDLTASTPPMGGSIPQPDLNPNFDMLWETDQMGLGASPRRFTADELSVFDEGLPFTPDPEMAGASITRGGVEPGTVADTLLSDELGARPDPNTGRPLDVETATRLSQPGETGDDFVAMRPAEGLGEDLGTGFGEPPAAPLLEDLLSAIFGDFEPGVGPRPRPGYDPYADAVDAEILGMRRPDAGPARPLPAPEGQGLGDMLTLADEMPPPDDVRARYRGERDIPPGARIIEAETKDGYIAARPMEDGSWQIRSAYVKEGSRGKGIGKDNLLKLAREVQDEGGVLNSDSKLSADQVRVYKSLRDSGRLDFEGDLDAVLAAMDDTDNATNPSGEPWLRNIRLGPAE